MTEAQQGALRRQAIFWIIALIFFTLFLWVFSDILLPFVAGLAMAYFLDPVADMLQRWKLSRLAATVIILFLMVLSFMLALLVLIPVLGVQIAGLLERLPDYVSRLQTLISSLDIKWLDRFGSSEQDLVRDNTGELVKQGAAWIGTVLQKLWASGKSLLSVFSLLVVTPVVAFYMLNDWDRMVKQVDDLLPRDHRDTIRQIMSDINKAVAGFIRGQGTLCLVLGIMYASALSLVGLNFGLLIGLFAGFVSFIPYVGSISGFVLSVGVALVQFWPNPVPIAIVAGIFIAGQFIEGNILQPKLVGDRVGLHPVWVMFALFAFGSLFGFTGLLVAVPAAAAVGVVVRYSMQRYLESELYTGHDNMVASNDQSGPSNDRQA